MLKHILLPIIITSSFLLSMSVEQVNRASKDELGCIKGIGVKKLQAIIDYKKNNHIENLDNLLKIKGIGKGILKNIKENIVKKSCGKNKLQSNSKKNNRPRKKINAE